MFFWKTKPCPYCGNNPVPHFLTWYFESTNTLLAPLREILLDNFFSRWLARAAKLGQWFWLVLEFFAGLKIISFQDNWQKCRVARAKVLWQAALSRGINFREALLFGRPFDVYVAEKFGRTLVFSGLPRPALARPKTIELMDDKIGLKKMFVARGLPVPQGRSVWTFRQAVKVFERLPKPIIVKPRTGSRGRHTTTLIYTRQELQQAFRIAKQLCFWVIVEEHLSGPVYRGTVVDFQVRGILRGDAPSVTGDGQHSLTELIEQFNSGNHPGVQNIRLGPLTEGFLQRQGLSLKSIPQAGVKVTLSEKIGVSYGGSSAEDLLIAHPDNKGLFEQAAKVLGDALVGFDFIIPDITKSYKHQHCGFIEANSLPFINLHHDPLHGPPQDVASRVWEMVGF